MKFLKKAAFKMARKIKGKRKLEKIVVYSVYKDKRIRQLERVLLLPRLNWDNFTHLDDRSVCIEYAYILVPKRAVNYKDCDIKYSHLPPVDHETEVDKKEVIPQRHDDQQFGVGG